MISPWIHFIGTIALVTLAALIVVAIDKARHKEPW